MVLGEAFLLAKGRKCLFYLLSSNDALKCVSWLNGGGGFKKPFDKAPVNQSTYCEQGATQSLFPSLSKGTSTWTGAEAMAFGVLISGGVTNSALLYTSTQQ